MIAAECFPVLSLEQVYGAITYYLGHRGEVDAYLQQMNVDAETFQLAIHDPEFLREKSS